MYMPLPIIKLYGTKHCHKTVYYKEFFKNNDLTYEFLDVKEHEAHAEELRSLYENKKLNFPTITIGNKKLRNPSDRDLQKWIQLLIPEILEIKHDKKQQQFILNINDDVAKVTYELKDNKMRLVYSEVPHNLRGKGIGKVLVQKTFEKLTAEGYKAVAICSFIKRVALESDEWKDIIE
ncbi:N-acetyltransferase [Tenacibaculum maritimum]|uniref:N-acetyltransferase n=2 Tax=Tenacibaculum maritimum TaxID=107401 RepID=UPI0012E5A091|nr:putative acetyltransferase [Tenacibaculum maritimum]